MAFPDQEVLRQILTTRRACPICGSWEAEWLTTMNFALPEISPLPPDYDLVVCCHCGCSYADSNATEADYAKYYRVFSKYEETSIATGSGTDTHDRMRLDELAAYLSSQVAFSARIADFGAGNGGLLKSLRMLGHQHLTGFDPSPICVGHMREAGLDARVLVLPLDETDGMAALSGYFDLIVLSHVLEHVFNVRSTIASLLYILAPEGKLYIEVPDPARYDASAYPPFYFFDPEHINHLDKVALCNLASIVGLSVSDIGRKVIALQNGSEYPALYGLLLRSEVLPQPEYYPYDFRKMLAGYIEDSQRQLESLRGRILELLGNTEHIAVWGAGSFTQRLLGQDWFPRDRIVAIVDRDNSKVGLKFMGMVIQSPEMGLRELPTSTPVLCAAAIAGDQIAREYYSLKLPHPFINILEPDYSNS